MQKIFNVDLLDIFQTEKGFIYACKEKVDNGEAVAFFEYNKDIDVFDKISINYYISSKFGKNGFIIAKALGDFVRCDLRKVSSYQNSASYSDGKTFIYDNNGLIIDSFTVTHNNHPACGPAVYKGDLWYAVPEENAIIKYSVNHKRTEMRIGSVKEKAFSHPVSIERFDDTLYICNSNSFQIKTLDLNTFDVNDLYVFNEPVFKYFRLKDTEYVILNSGVYSL